MSPLMAIGIITVATVRPPFFFFFSKFLFPFQPSSSGFEVEGNLRTLSFDRIDLSIFLQILREKSIRDDTNVEMSLLNYVGPGDI